MCVYQLYLHKQISYSDIQKCYTLIYFIYPVIWKILGPWNAPHLVGK